MSQAQCVPCPSDSRRESPPASYSREACGTSSLVVTVDPARLDTGGGSVINNQDPLHLPAVSGSLVLSITASATSSVTESLVENAVENAVRSILSGNNPVHKAFPGPGPGRSGITMYQSRSLVSADAKERPLSRRRALLNEGGSHRTWDVELRVRCGEVQLHSLVPPPLLAAPPAPCACPVPRVFLQ